MSEKSKTANGRAAQLMSPAIQTYATSSAGLNEVLDMRGYSRLTILFPEGSTTTQAVRVGMVVETTSTEQMSTGGLDLMTVTGASSGTYGSTAVIWPYAFLSSTSTAATLYSLLM